MKPQLSRVGLGCVTFGREISEAESFRILDYACEHSITLLDTAESYGQGSSERIIGRWLRSNGQRDRVTVATKASRGFTRAHLREALDASLERLQTGWADLYLLHSFDPAVPLEETLEALTQAVEEGKIRAAGCSNFSPAQLRTALELSARHGFTRLAVTEPMYNLLAREAESGLFPLTREHRIAVMAYSPLAAGFLTGKYGPDRASIAKGTRFDIKPGHADIYFKPENFHVVEQLRAMAARTGVSEVRLAMGWVLANPAVDCVLVGARSTAHLDNAIASLAAPLPASWLEEMNQWDARHVPPTGTPAEMP